MGSGTAVLQQPPGLSISEDVIKPRCDKLGYRVVKLPNELRVLLISDPETDKAAAALNVRVGSMCDPVELPGLAHFCEHMLFYSSEKYPVEDEYSRFISDHGGHTNAFTAAEDTNYQFDVNWDALPEALDRFAQFFISPLISGDGVEREVQAVDSEHGKNLAVDAWRLHQLCKATANQEHPWARFFTGNLETLLTAPTKAGIDVRAAVADWHARHYSANLMTAAVYGRHSLDELQQLAAEAFSGVANTGLAAPQFSEDLYTDEHRGLLVRVVPIKESHTLEIQWDIPPTEALYRQAPTNYLSHLLGHEGAGSAFALLKAAGLATSLTAGEGSGISRRTLAQMLTLPLPARRPGSRLAKEHCRLHQPRSMANNENLQQLGEDGVEQEEQQGQQELNRRTLEVTIMAAVTQLIQPAAVSQQHRHLVTTAMQQHPAAENLQQLLDAAPELYDSLVNIDTPESQSFENFIPDSQGTDINDDGDYAVFQTVIDKGSTPWVGNLPGARHHFYLPPVEGVLPLCNEKRRGFHARTGIAYGFRGRSLHTRTKAMVMCEDAVKWLGDAFSGLKPHLQALGSGRVVMWYDIPRHSNCLTSAAMPVALPEEAWMQAQLELATGDGPSFSGLDLFPLPAVLYMLYYHPKVAMPAAVGSIEQQRQQVFSKLSSKPGCPPQAAQDLEELLTMLLRYMLIQTKVVPAVYKYGTGGVDEQDDWSGSYVLFSPENHSVHPEEYPETEYKLYKSSLALAAKNAAGVLEHTSSICVCDGMSDACSLNMSEYANKLAMYVQMPHQPSQHFYSAFSHYSTHWSNTAAREPQLHFYSAQQRQFITEPKLTKQAAGLATSLTAGEGSGISSRSFFSVRLELTAEGNARPGEVAEVVFKYLELLRAPGGVNEQIYAELAGLSELRFHWRDKLPPYSVTTSLAGAMAHYPDRDLLVALYHVPQEFDPACIHSFLELLTPQRARLTWATRSHDTSQQQQQQNGDSTQTAASNGNGCGTSAAPAAAVLAAPELIQEPIYSTKHAVCRIPGQWMSAWTDGVALPGLHLPAANPFVPDDLSLRPEVGEKEGVPQLLLHGPSARVWQRTELRFGSPKATIVLDIQTPAAYASPESAVCVRLLVKLLGDYLNEVAYPAELAGLSYSLTNHLAGFQLSCQGYSEKLPVLLGLLLGELANFKVKPERFAVVKEAVAREYANTAYQQPYQWAMYRSELLLNFKRWRVDQYSQIIKALTPEALAAHMPRLLGRAFLEGLIVGNISPEEAYSIVDSALTKVRGALLEGLIVRNISPSEALIIVDSALTKLRAAWGAAPLWPGEEKDLRVVKLPAGASSLLVEAGPNPKNENSAVWVTYQVGPDDLRRNALAGLLVQLAKRDAFNTLRTQQQLGYIVHMYGASDLGVQGISFIIQSDKYSAAHLALQVELFVRDTVKRIASLPEAEFEAGVAELAKAKLEKPKRLGELAGRWWGEIYAGTCMFDRQAAEVEVLRTLKPEDLARFSEEVLGVEREVRRKAVVLIRGSNELQQQQGEAAAATAAGQGSCAADEEQQIQAAAAAAAEAPGPGVS
ncbi:hypothetical protein OEZ86_012206 [Tetradesmus obliquus]|nr:hypothetical protein OEZ86_012206 [Tetradesmus obliquus]